VLQGRIGAYKLGVVGNTIYVLLQTFSRTLLSKIMKIGSQIKKVIAKIKRVPNLSEYYTVLIDLLNASLQSRRAVSSSNNIGLSHWFGGTLFFG